MSVQNRTNKIDKNKTLMDGLLVSGQILNQINALTAKIAGMSVRDAMPFVRERTERWKAFNDQLDFLKEIAKQ